MLDDIADDFAKPILKLVILCLRGLLFLGWDFCVETVGWTIGWWFYRAITLGKFPTEKWEEQENAPLILALSIEFTGLGILAGLIYLLTKLV